MDAKKELPSIHLSFQIDRRSKDWYIPLAMRRREFLLSALSGILLILIFPFFDLGILAWGALIPWLWAIRTQAPYQAALYGLITGFIFFGGLLYWIYVVLTQYGHLPGPVSVFFLLALNAYLAIYFGAFGYLFRLTSERYPWLEILLAPSIWVTLEYVRGFLFSGFPWELLGYSQYRFLAQIQMAEFTGVYGLSFLIVMVNVAIYQFIRKALEEGWLGASRHLVIAGILLIASNLYGAYRIDQIDGQLKADRPFKIVLVQGNIRQDIKWEPSFQRETIRIYSDLTRQGRLFAPDLIIWPETSTPFFFQEPSTLHSRVLELVDEVGSPLLLGAPGYEQHGRQVHYYNSAFVVTPQKGITGRYNKIHLVPFGEYAPFAEILDFTRSIIGAIGDFTPGKGIQLLSLPWTQLGVLICYEAIFPDLTRQFVDRGARFLVNITNDAWFGRTSAPYQHFSMVVFRAVENRVSIARAANTGISGVIDPTGRIQIASGIFTSEVISGNIYLNKSKTFYSRYGDLFAFCCIFITVAVIIFRIKGVNRVERNRR